MALVPSGGPYTSDVDLTDTSPDAYGNMTVCNLASTNPRQFLCQNYRDDSFSQEPSSPSEGSGGIQVGGPTDDSTPPAPSGGGPSGTQDANTLDVTVVETFRLSDGENQNTGLFIAKGAYTRGFSPVEWTNPDGARIEDAANASASTDPDEITNMLVVDHFGFNLPQNAQPIGISLSILGSEIGDAIDYEKIGLITCAFVNPGQGGDPLAAIFGGWDTNYDSQQMNSITYVFSSGATGMAPALAEARDFGAAGHSNGEDGVVFGAAGNPANNSLEKYNFGAATLQSVTIGSSAWWFFNNNLAVGPAEFCLIDFRSKYTYADDTVAGITVPMSPSSSPHYGSGGDSGGGDYTVCGNIPTTAYVCMSGLDDPFGSSSFYAHKTYDFSNDTMTDSAVLQVESGGNCSFSSQTDSYFNGEQLYTGTSPPLIQKFNYAGGTTSVATNCDTPRPANAGACSDENNGYLMGGESFYDDASGETDDISSYVRVMSFADETWTLGTNLPSSRGYMAVLSSTPGNV